MAFPKRGPRSAKMKALRQSVRELAAELRSVGIRQLAAGEEWSPEIILPGDQDALMALLGDQGLTSGELATLETEFEHHYMRPAEMPF